VSEALASRPSGRGVDVCLLSMPYGAVQRPSIATALLKSLIVRDGFSAVALYPNLWLAQWVGLKVYHLVDYSRSEDLIGEWTFAGVAFPDFQPDHEAFLDEVCERLLVSNRIRRRLGGAEKLRDACYQLRELASDFVDHVVDRVLEYRPRIVGCTSTFQQHVPSLALLRRLRERAPEVVNMIGGANCETEMGHATHRNLEWVDYLISGEADGFIGELVGRVLEHGRELEAESCPHGVFAPCHRRVGYRCDAGSQLPRAVSSDLRGLPPPDFSEFFETLKDVGFDSAIMPGLLIETSRGCWWGERQHCTFCGLNGSGMAFRSRPAEEVLAEIRLQSVKHGRRNFEVVDNILDMRYFKTLLPALREDETSYQLFYEIKANMSRDRVAAMKEAGIDWVQPGIESMHSELLGMMDKGVAAWQNVLLLKWCRELGVRLSWNFLFGFPGERDECYSEMAAWLPLISHFQPPTGLLQIRVDRYSPYHTQNQRYGLTLKPSRCYQYVYPFDAESLMGQAYFFEYEGEIDYLRGGAGIGFKRRAGLYQLWQVASKWLGPSWWVLPPLLKVSEDGDALHFFDTREVAVERSCRLEGLARRVYLLSEDARTFSQIESSLAKTSAAPVDRQQVAQALDDLVARRLVLHIDDRYLGLALRGDVPQLPKSFPGGYVTDWPKHQEKVKTHSHPPAQRQERLGPLVSGPKIEPPVSVGGAQMSCADT